MVLKGHFTFPISLELEPHYRKHFSVIPRIFHFFVVLPFCRGYNQYIPSLVDKMTSLKRSPVDKRKIEFIWYSRLISIFLANQISNFGARLIKGTHEECIDEISQLSMAKRQTVQSDLSLVGSRQSIAIHHV